MSDWNPAQYLRFANERTQPARDLACRLADLLGASFPGQSSPRVLDLGCGPGNSTQVLAERLPGARLTGLDNSAAMIETAQSSGPQAVWICADAATWTAEGQYHAVFSNAALQWVPDQAAQLRRCWDWLEPGGVLAIQVPGNGDSGLHRAMRHTAARWPRRERFAGLAGQIHYHEPDFYHEQLGRLSPLVQVWETTYWHILANYQAMIDWYSGTGLRPWLQALDNDTEREVFCEHMLEDIRPAYPARPDGSLYFPFRRVFATAVKPAGGN